MGYLYMFRGTAAVLPALDEGAALLADGQHCGTAEGRQTWRGSTPISVALDAGTIHAFDRRGRCHRPCVTSRPARAPIEAGHPFSRRRLFLSRVTMCGPERAPVDSGQPIQEFRAASAGYVGAYTAAVTCRDDMDWFLPRLSGASRQGAASFLCSSYAVHGDEHRKGVEMNERSMKRRMLDFVSHSLSGHEIGCAQ